MTAVDAGLIGFAVGVVLSVVVLIIRYEVERRCFMRSLNKPHSKFGIVHEVYDDGSMMVSIGEKK